METMVDSYRFLDGIAKRTMQRWAGFRAERAMPWTPLGKPPADCRIAMVSSGALALKSDRPFDLQIEREDPWFADPPAGRDALSRSGAEQPGGGRAEEHRAIHAAGAVFSKD